MKIFYLTLAGLAFAEDDSNDTDVAYTGERYSEDVFSPRNSAFVDPMANFGRSSGGMASDVFTVRSDGPERIQKFIEKMVKMTIKKGDDEEEESANPMLAAKKSLAAGWANSMVNSINGYACWCYFEDDHGKGKGGPQNDIDSQCKILHDGYQCIMMDAEDDNIENCVPWEENYVVPTGLGWWSRTGSDEEMKAALRKDCIRKNRKNSECAQRSCIVEGYFSINLFKLLTSGTKYDHRLKHEYNKFDPQSQCITKVRPGVVEKQCCGSYPVRFPYGYQKDVRECCNGRTYNAEFLSCCDNEVKMTCF